MSLAVLRTRWLPPAVALAVFVGLWYLVSDVVLDADRRFLLPPPHAVVEEAILLHGGEGQRARDRFERLTSAQRRALLAFVESR